MNRRIRKKKEKRAIMNSSFELVPDYPLRKRRRIVNELWKNYTDAGLKLVTSYTITKK